MSFLVNEPASLGPDDWTSPDQTPKDAYLLWLKKRFEEYKAYLEAIKHRLPVSVYEFAVADWHYNPQDPRCPHDAWLQEVKVRELASGDRQEIRRTQIEIVLLGAYHDRLLKLSYFDVTAYSLASPSP